MSCFQHCWKIVLLHCPINKQKNSELFGIYLATYQIIFRQKSSRLAGTVVGIFSTSAWPEAYGQSLAGLKCLSRDQSDLYIHVHVACWAPVCARGQGYPLASS